MIEAPDICIEPIRLSHVEGFRQALDMVSRERKYLARFEAAPLEKIRAFVLEMIDNGHPQFVATKDGVVVGWCDIRRNGRDTDARCGTLGMGIIPGYRDRGLGRRLIETTLEAARASGIHRVELHVNADNSRAIALYEKAGFVREGVAREAVKIDDRYIDSIRMAKIFR